MAVFCAMCCYDYLIPLTRPYSLTGFRPSRVRLPQSMHCPRCRCSLSRFVRICARLNLVAHAAEQKRSRCGGTGRPSKGHRGWVDSTEARLLAMAIIQWSEWRGMNTLCAIPPSAPGTVLIAVVNPRNKERKERSPESGPG